MCIYILVLAEENIDMWMCTYIMCVWTYIVYVFELVLQWKLEKPIFMKMLICIYAILLIKLTVLFLGDTEPVNAWYLARMQSQIRCQSWLPPYPGHTQADVK